MANLAKKNEQIYSKKVLQRQAQGRDFGDLAYMTLRSNSRCYILAYVIMSLQDFRALNLKQDERRVCDIRSQFVITDPTCLVFLFCCPIANILSKLPKFLKFYGSYICRNLHCGLYYKTIMIVIMTIVNDATIWSITYNPN